MGVDSKAYHFLIKVQNGVEVLQEKVTKQEVAVVERVKGVLGDRELTDAFALVEISGWGQLEDGLADQEGDWLELFGKRVTCLR